ncbi:MAG: hypothetical protein K6A94_13250 [Bacteroidales bacterium]|nr:hypothetical protein [Muribaculaceae bacterium]MCR5040287.1 hypothetical protein [Bacteroidales bacterium]
MNINFHYHAIKSIAREAGLSEDDAELIAGCSQLIDDFNDYAPFIVNNVPDYAKHLCAHFWRDYYIFRPVTTGFSSWFDMVTLADEKNQKNIAIPFHFIPEKKRLNEEVQSRAEWRTKPARMDVPSLIQTKMNELLNNTQLPYDDKLVCFGSLLHTFADTYAHQMFSGFHGWENYCYLNGVYDVKDVASQNDFSNTTENQAAQQFYAIGHANANHVPDDTSQRFTFKMKRTENGDYDLLYARSNPIEFTKCARVIYDIVRTFMKNNGKSTLIFTKNGWEHFTPKLCEAMYEQDPDKLNAHWEKVFSWDGYKYHYSRDNVFGTATVKENLQDNPKLQPLLAKVQEHLPIPTLGLVYSMSNHYYRFNVQAENLRSYVNGTNVAENELEGIREIVSQIKKELRYED